MNTGNTGRPHSRSGLLYHARADYASARHSHHALTLPLMLIQTQTLIRGLLEHKMAGIDTP